ncbi:MAG TPA: ATP-binding protein [Ktedonosporobacter sp.]|nr:ATP-binding protein [Ktedonosporobacter sp.]
MKSRTSNTSKEVILAALEATHGITLLHNVLNDAAGHSVLTLLRALVNPQAAAAEIARAYSQAFNALAAAANEEIWVAGLADAWQAHLITRILDDTNQWSTQAERAGATGIAPAIRSQAQRDLRALRLFFDLTAETFWCLTREAVTPTMPELHDAWVPWYDLAPSPSRTEVLTARDILGQRLIEHEDWTDLVDPLTEHWARHGTGLFARYHVLRWQGREEGLQGISYPDPIQLSSLIGYEREQGKLKANTERFLQGLPAHDTVLYGTPGTGKSSTVKALANAYADRGLRLVEVSKELVSDLPQIAALLRGRAPRFLIFIDDLSFEEHEVQYKALKVLLEGSAEVRPNNVLIYATTNRLNLIRESFSDRGKPTEDVHWRDTMDEKNSLVARFGLRVTFVAPDQERYLKIAVELAQQRGIDLPEEDLRMRALLWERQRSGRSGRTARQFVDDLEADYNFSKERYPSHKSDPSASLSPTAPSESRQEASEMVN